MGNTVIEVESLSKRYRIGVQQQADTFAQQVKQTLAYPIRNFRRIASLTKFAGDEDPSVFWALRDINFQVREGEVLGIIGHNGAGKSTLLKLLSQITEPTGGRVKIKGRVSALLEVGTGFHPELTGRDNVYMNGTILGMRKKEIDLKFEEIVEFSGVKKHIDTPLKFYSSGMKVRLAFAVAAHLEPEILVIDEVLAVGDAEFQKKCLGKMEDVANEGRTVLFVSHDMPAVSALCTRGIMLKGGNLVYSGEVKDVVNRYLDQQTEAANAGLAQMQERKGNGKVRFTDAQFVIDKNNLQGNTLYAGSPGYIRMKLQSNAEQQLEDVTLVLVVQDVQQQILGTIHSRFSGDMFQLKPGENEILCHLPKVNLIPGKYWITVRAMAGGESGLSAELLDHVDQGANFFVEGGDYYGSGKIPNSKHGVFMMDFSWEGGQD